MKDSQLSARLAGVPQRFLELLPLWLAIDASLSFKTVWKASVVVLSRYRFKRSSNFMPRAVHSFSLGRCQGWLSKHLDEGSCSDGLLLLHPQLSVQLWGLYGEA